MVEEFKWRALLCMRLPTLGPALIWLWDFLRGHFLRKRVFITWIIPAVLMYLLFRNDPDPDHATSLIFTSKLVERFLIVTCAHFALKLIFDYKEADRQQLFKIIVDPGPGDEIKGRRRIAAACALISQALFFLAIVLAFVVGGNANAATLDVAKHVPARCEQNISLLKSEQARWWADHPDPAMLAALAEHESCVSLTSSRCCNTASQLKACRKDGQCEEGASILQVTRVRRADGSLRFDTLQELKDRHPMLREWSWANVYQRADLANRALVLMSLDNYRILRPLAADDANGLDFTDVAHNAGNGRIIDDRRACALARTVGCDPRIWKANVELYCTANRAALYGSRGPCEISRHHIGDVRLRAGKYRKYWT